MKGNIKFYDENKSFGFIEGKGHEKDIFFHKSEIRNATTLREGDAVKYDQEETPRGMKAINVQKI